MLRGHEGGTQDGAPGVSSITVLHGLEVLTQLGVELAPVWLALGGRPSRDAPCCRWPAVAAGLMALAAHFDPVLEERFAARFVVTHPLLKLAAPLSLSPRGIMELVSRAHATFGLLSGKTEYRFERHQLVVRTALPRELQPCPLWWRLAIAVLGQVPAVVGHAPLTLQESHVSDDLVEARWALPAERPRGATAISPATVLGALSQLVPVVEGLELSRQRLPHARDFDEVSRLQVAHGLTAAEARIALQLADGLTARETATELRVSYQTVRAHLRNINARLELASQRELVSLVERWRAHGL